MSGYRLRVQEHVRLVLLRLLADAPGYASNSSLLDDALDDFGMGQSRDQVNSELAWLAEQGLVTSAEPLPGVVSAKLTTRGLDVARGQASVPGVRRPSPGA